MNKKKTIIFTSDKCLTCANRGKECDVDKCLSEEREGKYSYRYMTETEEMYNDLHLEQIEQM